MSQDQDPKAKPLTPAMQEKSDTSAFSTLDFGGDITKELDDLLGGNDDFFGASTGSSVLDDLFASTSKKEEVPPKKEEPPQKSEPLSVSTPSVTLEEQSEPFSSPKSAPKEEKSDHSSTLAVEIDPLAFGRPPVSNESLTHTLERPFTSPNKPPPPPPAPLQISPPSDPGKTISDMSFSASEMAAAVAKMARDVTLEEPVETEPLVTPEESVESEPLVSHERATEPSDTKDSMDALDLEDIALMDDDVELPPPPPSSASRLPPPPPSSASRLPPPPPSSSGLSVEPPKKQRAMAQTIAFGPGDLAMLQNIHVASDAPPETGAPQASQENKEADLVEENMSEGTPPFGSVSVSEGTPPFGSVAAPDTSSVSEGTPPFGSVSVSEGTPPFGSVSVSEGTPPFGSVSVSEGTPPFGAPAVADTASREKEVEVKKPERPMAQTLMFGFDISQVEGFQKAQEALAANDKTEANDKVEANDKISLGIAAEDSDMGGATMENPAFSETPPSAASASSLSALPKAEMNKTMAFGLNIGDFMSGGLPESTLEDIPKQAIEDAVREREQQKASAPAISPSQTVTFGAEEIAEEFKARAARMNVKETAEPIVQKKPAASQTLMFGSEDVLAMINQRAAQPTPPQATEEPEARPAYAVTVDLSQSVKTIQEGTPADSFFDALLPANVIQQAVQERLAAQQAEQAPPIHPGVAAPPSIHPGVAAPSIHPGVAAPHSSAPSTRKPSTPPPSGRANSAPPKQGGTSLIPLILAAGAVLLLGIYVLGFVWPGFFR